MENKKKSFIWNSIGLTFNAFNSLFFLVIVNRINGIEEAGIFSYNFSLVCLFYIMALYYNRTYQVADIKDQYSRNQYITSRLLTSLITLIIVIGFGLLNGFSLFKLNTLILLMIFRILEAISDCFHGFIQKKDQLYYVGESLFGKAILGILAFGIGDYLTHDLSFSILLLVIVNIIGLGIDIKKYKSLYKEPFKFQFNKLTNLLKETFPVFVFSFLTIFINNSQKYVMNYILNDSFQTIFGIIVMPATMISLCGQYLIGPYVNELSHLYSEKKLDSFKKIIKKITIIIGIIGIIASIAAYFLGIPVLNIIYSISLEGYQNALLIIILGAILYSISNIISGCLTIIGRNKEQLYAYLSTTIISCVISYLLIKNSGVVGASYAYFLTMFVHFLLTEGMLIFYLHREEKRK